jgi:hypothetical protein
MPTFDTRKQVSAKVPYLNISRDRRGVVIMCTKTNEFGCAGCIMRASCEVTVEGE